MDGSRMTRAELAVRSGVSKPTAAEAVRRLQGLGLVADTGERTTGRGGVGTYYALAETVGIALAVAIAPDGIVAEAIDATGVVRARTAEAVARPAPPALVKRLLGKVARSTIHRVSSAPVRVAVVSAADPVDRITGDLVELPDAPFLLGALSPTTVLRPLVDGPMLVDNDVNWAARAERDARRSADGATVEDFVYIHLGEGLGCAVMADGRVLRGNAGLAGEIAHVLTVGARERATPFTSVFDQLGLRHPNSTAIDVERLLRRLSDPRRGPALTEALARAITGVLTAAAAFCDPRFVVLGGPWGGAEAVLGAVQRQVALSPRPIPVDSARVTTEPALAGARWAARQALRDDLVTRIRVNGS